MLQDAISKMDPAVSNCAPGPPTSQAERLNQRCVPQLLSSLFPMLLVEGLLGF